MIDSLLIHTGDPKTGTSSIQSVLNSGAWHCSSARLVPQPHLNNAPFANALEPDCDPDFREAQCGALRDWFAAHDGGTGVISTEFLSRRSPHRLRAVLDEYFPGLPVRTLSYVRPHLSRAVSAYGQRLKTGTFDGSPEEFWQHITTVPSLFYNQRFPGWRSVFGSGMILRPFLRSELRGGNAVEDFLAIALETEAFSLQPAEPVNEALFVAELAGMRFVQRSLTAQLLSNHHKQSVGGALQRLLTALPGRSGEKPGLDQAGAQLLAGAFRGDARALDRAFFGRPLLEAELDRACSSAAPAGQDFRPEAHYTASQRSELEEHAVFIARKLIQRPKAWRQEYQVSTAQRAAADIADASPAQQQNAREVWQALDAIAAILVQPQPG